MNFEEKESEVENELKKLGYWNDLYEKNNYFVDFTEALEKINNKAYAIKGTHLSPEGYRIVSKKLLKKVNTLQQK